MHNRHSTDVSTAIVLTNQNLCRYSADFSKILAGRSCVVLLRVDHAGGEAVDNKNV